MEIPYEEWPVGHLENLLLPFEMDDDFQPCYVRYLDADNMEIELPLDSMDYEDPSEPGRHLTGGGVYGGRFYQEAEIVFDVGVAVASPAELEDENILFGGWVNWEDDYGIFNDKLGARMKKGMRGSQYFSTAVPKSLGEQGLALRFPRGNYHTGKSPTDGVVWGQVGSETLSDIRSAAEVMERQVDRLPVPR